MWYVVTLDNVDNAASCLFSSRGDLKPEGTLPEILLIILADRV